MGKIDKCPPFWLLVQKVVAREYLILNITWYEEQNRTVLRILRVKDLTCRLGCPKKTLFLNLTMALSLNIVMGNTNGTKKNWDF